MNNLLYIDGKKRISDSTLASITILIAKSIPEEKQEIVNLILNFLNI